jgi:hypothetical protein
MVTAPKAIRDKAVKTACAYRDSQAQVNSVRVQQRFYDRYKKAFDVLVKAMKCEGSEELMVHETLMSIVHSTPPKMLVPGKDY